MAIVLCYALAFVLAAYGFAFGWKLGYKQFRDEISPRRNIEPRFRVVWRNPKSPDRKQSK